MILTPRELSRYHRQVVALLVAGGIACIALGWALSRLGNMQEGALQAAQDLLAVRDEAERAAVRQFEGARLGLIGAAGQHLMAREDVSADAKKVPLDNLDRLYGWSRQRIQEAKRPLKTDGPLEAGTYAMGQKGILPLNPTADGRISEAAVQEMLSSDADMKRLLDIARQRAAGETKRDRFAEQMAKVQDLAARKAAGQVP